MIKRMVSRLIMVQQIALRREANFTTSEADTDEGNGDGESLFLIVIVDLSFILLACTYI